MLFPLIPQSEKGVLICVADRHAGIGRRGKGGPIGADKVGAFLHNERSCAATRPAQGDAGPVVCNAGEGRCDGGNASEQTIILAIDSRRELKRVGIAAAFAVAEGQAPKARHFDRASVGVVHQGACPRARCRVENIDPAIAKITYEDIPCVVSEPNRGQRHAPGSIERSLSSKTLEEIAAGIEDVHITVPRAADIGVAATLQGVGDKELSIDVLDAKG